MVTPFKHVLAEAMFAKNILLSVNGISPYLAVLGRYPRILSALEDAGLSAIDGKQGPHKHATRMRELAINTLVNAHAKER